MQGGIIILGIKEHHDEFEPNNLSDADIDKLQKEFWSGVRWTHSKKLFMGRHRQTFLGAVSAFVRLSQAQPRLAFFARQGINEVSAATQICKRCS